MISKQASKIITVTCLPKNQQCYKTWLRHRQVLCLGDQWRADFNFCKVNNWKNSDYYQL